MPQEMQPDLAPELASLKTPLDYSQLVDKKNYHRKQCSDTKPQSNVGERSMITREVVNGAIVVQNQPLEVAINIKKSCRQKQIHGGVDNLGVGQEKKGGKSVDD